MCCSHTLFLSRRLMWLPVRRQSFDLAVSSALCTCWRLQGKPQHSTYALVMPNQATTLLNFCMWCCTLLHSRCRCRVPRPSLTCIVHTWSGRTDLQHMTASIHCMLAQEDGHAQTREVTHRWLTCSAGQVRLWLLDPAMMPHFPDTTQGNIAHRTRYAAQSYVAGKVAAPSRLCSGAVDHTH